MHACVLRASKAPACEVGRIARAFQSSTGTTSRCVAAAAKVGETHGERDSNKVFKKFGLSLNVPISSLEIPGTSEHAPMSLPNLKVADYLDLLLRRYPKLLFGGKDMGQKCQEFWRKYRQFQPSHEVFARFPEENTWAGILPICVHGDKGRTYLKQPILCISWESVFGLPESIRLSGSRVERTRKRPSKQEHGGKSSFSCSKRALDMQMNAFDDSACPKRRKLASYLDHNGKGVTLMTRFLCTAIPSKEFKAHPCLIPGYLQQLQTELTELFEHGRPFKNGVLRLAIVGVKGDYEFHLECTEYSRSYQNIGSKRNHQFCPECMAGDDAVEGFDTREVPMWASTCYRSDPWPRTPILSRVPFDTCASQHSLCTMYRRDAFHTLKYGFLKDFVASSIMYLADLEYFDWPEDSKSLDSRLDRAHKAFKLFCLGEGKTPSLRKFTRGNFHRTRATKYPFLGGKGADSIIALQFLEFYLKLQLFVRGPKQEPDREVMMAMLETAQGALNYVGVYHNHGLFLPRPCASFQLQCGYKLLRGYTYLAQRCLQEGRKLYALRPKLHYYHHFLYDLKTQLQRGDTAILNYSSIFNCESNEDFIGRVSRLSRRVSPKLGSRRTIDHYLLACKLLFKRAGL